MEILKRLREKGAEVSYADPRVPSVLLDGVPLKAVAPAEETPAAADCAVILTAHPEFDYPRIVELAPLAIDTRNATRGILAPAGRIVAL